MITKLTKSPKKKGAQPANINAIKHGFYSHYFTPAEIQAVSQLNPNTLNFEIELSRIINRRILALWSASTNIETDSTLSELLIRSTAAIASLSRTQAILNKMNDINPLSELYSILEEFHNPESSPPIKHKRRPPSTT